MNNFSLDELDAYKEALTHSILNGMPEKSILGATESITIYDDDGNEFTLEDTYDFDKMSDEEIIAECRRLGLLDMDIEIELE